MSTRKMTGILNSSPQKSPVTMNKLKTEVKAQNSTANNCTPIGDMKQYFMNEDSTNTKFPYLNSKEGD
jgi:hypothetical protein